MEFCFESDASICTGEVDVVNSALHPSVFLNQIGCGRGGKVTDVE